MNTKRPISPGAEELIDMYFPVLDYGFVSLVDYKGNDASIERAARMSYGESTRHVSKREILLRYLERMEHGSPFEIPVFELHMGMPIFIMRQWVRHRISSMNEYSGRYSVMPMLFYQPKKEQVCVQSKQNKQGRADIVNDEIYTTFTSSNRRVRSQLSDNYNYFINNYDIARETARIDLPLSTYTYCHWQANLRSLFNLMKLRSDSHAQWEVQQFANVVCGIVKAWCPIAFNAFQDYEQTAVKFTQTELSFLPYVFGDNMNKLSIENELSKKGLTKREIAEFWNKLKPKPKVDYTLDLSTVKSNEYFMNIIHDAAVEFPSEL